MKKIFFVLSVILVVITSCSQDKSDFSGIWKITILAENQAPAANYLIFNTDKTFTLGVDSTGNIKNQQLVKGKWEITADKEVKLVPDEVSMGGPAYYVKIGDNKYKYEYYEKSGVKTKFDLAKTEWYLEKVK